MLTDTERTELHRLQDRAYGRQSTSPLNHASRARLSELEQKAATLDRAPTVDEDATERVEQLVDSPEPLDEPEDGTLPPRQSAARGVAFGVLGLGVGLILGAFGAGQLYSPPSAVTLAGAPPIPDPAVWEKTSIQYLGTFESVHLWVADRDHGETTCLVVEDASGDVLPSMQTCQPAAEALKVGLTQTAVSGPAGATGRYTVRAAFVSFPDGKPVLTLIERVTTEPEVTLRELDALRTAAPAGG